MLDWFLRLIDQVQGAVFLDVVQPALYAVGLMEWSDDAFDGVGFALYGAIAVALAYLLFRPLEWLWPVERWGDRRAVRTDIIYSLVSRIGLVPAIIFLMLTPISVLIDSTLRFRGYIPPEVEQLLPSLEAWPFVTFLIYVVLLDFAEYWRHRLQHRLSWWWALHSLHHDQRQMTLWSDDRNHVLDDILQSVWAGSVALVIGVAPAEFPLVLVAFRLVESLAHTNVRLGFGRVGGMLLVGPQYHRLHHDIEHARPPYDRAKGCNFAVIFPVWDIIFGTWRRTPGFPRTGVAALDGAAVRCGYLRHQWQGFCRLGAELARFADPRRRGFIAALPGSDASAR